MSLLSLAGPIAACDRSSPDEKQLRWEDPPAVRSEGPRFEDRDFVLRLGAPKRCEDTGALGPEPGWIRYSVPVTVTATGTREVPVGPMSFTLEDRDGHQFRPTLAGCQPVFSPTKLSGDQQIEGHLAFDVRDPGQLFEVVFEPFVIGRSPIVARARLPREDSGAP